MPKDSVVNKLENETIEMASKEQSTKWKKIKTKNPKIARTIKVNAVYIGGVRGIIVGEQVAKKFDKKQRSQEDKRFNCEEINATVSPAATSTVRSNLHM